MCEQEGGMIRAVCWVDNSRARTGDDYSSWVRVGVPKSLKVRRVKPLHEPFCICQAWPQRWQRIWWLQEEPKTPGVQ